jgi:O-succinylbenzoic acid--CoA ligase
MIVPAWLARAAAARPPELALIGAEGEGWSYARLFGAAAAGARELADAGAGPRERVAIALPPGLAFAHALHSCLLLGAVAVPVDLRLGAPERERLAAGCGVLLEEPLPAFGASPRSGGAGPVSGGAGPVFTHDLDAPALLIHTSGSTAAPKPVELTYGNLLWSALGSAVAIGLEGRERWLCAMPLSHIGGLSILVRSAIYGSCAVIHERFETDHVLAALREQRITTVSLVATTLARLLDAGLERPPALRCALTGGGPVGAPLVRRALAAGVPVCLTYGLSEACSQVTTTPLAALEGQLEGPLTAGPPLFCTRLRVAEDGEILLAGPTLARAAVAADGWLHTGDLGSLDGRGRLSVTGRKADTIVSGGENVAPAEVEAALESHPLVLEAGVFARPDERWGEVVSALVVTRPGAEEPSAAELREHCARMLASYKVPKQLLLASAPLPRTASGKLLRRELADRAGAGVR